MLDKIKIEEIKALYLCVYNLNENICIPYSGQKH